MIDDKILDNLKMSASEVTKVKSNLGEGAKCIDFITEACTQKIFEDSRNLYLRGSKAQNPDAKWVRDAVVKCVCGLNADMDTLNERLKEPLTPEQAYCVVQILKDGVTDFKTPSHEVCEMITLGLVNIDSFVEHLKGR